MGFFDDPNAPQAPGGGIAAPDQTGQAQPALTAPQPQSAGQGGPLTFQQANDPAYVRQQATDALTRRAQATGAPPPNQQQIDEAVNYVLKPDTYSDNQVRSGWSPYWAERFGVPGMEGSSGADKGGDSTLIKGAVPSLGGGGGGALPAGYSTGNFTGGGQYPLASVMAPGLMQPWTTPFQSPGDFHSPGDFKPTTAADMEADPGYQFRKDQGIQGIQRNAAAAGTLRTGGALKDLATFNSGLASQEYGNVDARNFRNNSTAYDRAASENDRAYGRAANEYLQAYNIYDRNQGNQFNRLSSVAGIGQNAAAQTGNFGSTYASRAGDLTTDQGAVQAAGTVAKNNNNQGVLGSIFNTAGSTLAKYTA